VVGQGADDQQRGEQRERVDAEDRGEDGGSEAEALLVDPVEGGRDPDAASTSTSRTAIDQKEVDRDGPRAAT
jgi:hypothetical protein